MSESEADLKSRVLRRIFLAQFGLLLTILIMIVVGTQVTNYLGSFFFAFFCGALGASLSLVRRLRSEQVQDLARLSQDLFSTAMPLLYGAILASVAYLLFMSGILTGDGGSGLFTSNLFPSFTAPEPSRMLTVPEILNIRPASVQDFGKLLVWCFVAGFSEKFVLGILETIASRQGGGGGSSGGGSPEGANPGGGSPT